jgi:sulfatase modifying factor 1
MKTKLHSLFIGLALLAGVHHAIAQGSQFFRIAGPAATTITAFNPDGTLVWSNALAGTNYTVQTVSSFPGGTNWVDYVQLPVTNSVNTNLLVAFNPPAGMALIPAGEFTIGNSIGDNDITDAHPTNVYVSAFYMDVNLVSSNQWAGVYTYAKSQGYVFSHAGLGKAANHPVQTVDWFDCVKWSNARSAQAGLTPVYYTDTLFKQVFTNGDGGTTVYANWGANGYRLPTEAEWEKAARGGLIGQRFPWGDTISESQANYKGNPNPPNASGETYDLGPYTGYNTNFDTGGSTGEGGSYFTSPVGYFAPNGYGLNDMAGNVFEWCWDWYAGPTYPAGSPYFGGTDPRGPVGPLSARVLRGGHWFNDAHVARCCYRFSMAPTTSGNGIGFRCVRGDLGGGG